LYTPEEVRHYGELVFDLISKGILKLKVFEQYPFTTEAIQRAHKDLTSGKTVGKLVIKVRED
jgi:NADPH2:quinone reductase